jgi:ribulose-bisphosphate carboxylase large chain
VHDHLTAVYRIRADADSIEARARTIAVEQSVEMPVAAIGDARVLREVVGRVTAIRDLGGGVHEARVALAVETVGTDAGQLLNMLFGNTSIHDDVTLAAIELPPSLAAVFGGPRHGVAGLARRVGATGRALTCSALKPQGMGAADLAALAFRLASGGLDYVKDDHGLADQTAAPYAARVAAVAAAVRRASAATGHPTRYLPNVSGSLDAVRRQVAIARDHGLDTLLIAPMIVGLPTFQAIVAESPDMAFVAHPAMAGAARIAPEALLGTLFRVLGADGVIFPNVGGRFGYSAATCRAIAATARAALPGIAASLPVPAGGMTRARIPEILDFYGADAMLLVGGDLLSAGAAMAAEARAFQATVAGYPYERCLP